MNCIRKIELEVLLERFTHRSTPITTFLPIIEVISTCPYYIDIHRLGYNLVLSRLRSQTYKGVVIPTIFGKSRRDIRRREERHEVDTICSGRLLS